MNQKAIHTAHNHASTRSRVLVVIAAVVAMISIARVQTAPQVIAQMSPQQIEEAIKLGSNEREAKRFLDNYRLRPRAFGSAGPTIGIFSTPFSRVVMLAADARDKYATVTAESIPKELLAPEVHVHVWPHQLETAPDIASVRAVVLMPKGSRNRSEAIAPVRMSESVTNYSNLFGATWKGTGALAVFPISEFKEGREVRIVFDKSIPVVGIKSCDDCGVEIKLGKVK